MIEFITFTILSILAISIMRPGKTPPLENSLTIERPGRYRMTLAPQLNLAQPFIEVIADRLLELKPTQDTNLVWWFEITDKDVASHGDDHYYLKIDWRNGLLKFKAISPHTAAAEIERLRPREETEGTTQEDKISSTVFFAAKQLKISAELVSTT